MDKVALWKSDIEKEIMCDDDKNYVSSLNNSVTLEIKECAY